MVKMKRNFMEVLCYKEKLLSLNSRNLEAAAVRGLCFLFQLFKSPGKIIEVDVFRC